MTKPEQTKPTPPSIDELREKNRKLIKLLEQWSKEPPEESAEWWRDFEEELENNPLDF